MQLFNSRCLCPKWFSSIFISQKSSFLLSSYNSSIPPLPPPTSRPVRYIDIEYRLSIYRHFWKISISIWSFLKISISIWSFLKISISISTRQFWKISILIRQFWKISISMGAKSHDFCLFSVYFVVFFHRYVDGISNDYIDSRYIKKFEKILISTRPLYEI